MICFPIPQFSQQHTHTHKREKKKRRKRKPSNIGIVVSSSVRNNLNEGQINQCTDSHFYISNLLLCRKKTKQSKNNSTTVLL